MVSLDEYLAKVPGDRESAERAVAPYREMTPAERFEALAELLEEVAAILGDREPAGDGERFPFWRHWVDPSLGRPA